MESNIVRVYSIWISGRKLGDVDQQFPIETNIDDIVHNWSTDLKETVKQYFRAKAKREKQLKEFFQDYIVNLYAIEIDTKKFKKEYGLDFDINNDDVQYQIPYYAGYEFITVAERIVQF
jgi:hypothetical protein